MSQINEETILRYVTEKSYERGVEYYEMGMVLSLTLRGNLLFAEVQGSEYDPYNVILVLKDDTLESANCTCPYEWDGYCKHVVASLLTYAHDSEIIEARPALDELLSPLSRDDLQALVENLVNHRPDLAEVVDEFCESAHQKVG